MAAYNDWADQKKRSDAHIEKASMALGSGTGYKKPAKMPKPKPKTVMNPNIPVPQQKPVIKTSEDLLPSPTFRHDPSFADYLKIATEMGFGQGGTDYGALTSQLKGNAATGDAKLAAMYSQLQNSIAGDETGIRKSYDDAGAEVKANSAAAAGATNAAYDSTRANQTNQLAALGIGDASAVLAGSGNLAARDQGSANAGINTNSLANQNQLVQNKASAVNYNTGIGNAAGLEGATQRAKLQQDLAGKLAQLQTSQSTEASSNKNSLLQMALQLQESAQSRQAAAGSAQAEAAQQQFDNDLAAAKFALEQTKAQGSSVTLQDILGTYGDVSKAGVASGVANNPEDLNAFIQGLLGAKKLT